MNRTSPPWGTGIIIVLLLWLIATSAGAAVPARIISIKPAKEIGQVVNDKLTQRGFATNDPRYAGTMTGIASSVTQQAISGSIGAGAGVVTTYFTGQPWLGLLVSSGVTAGISAGIDWAFGTNGSIGYANASPLDNLGDPSINNWGAFAVGPNSQCCNGTLVRAGSAGGAVQGAIDYYTTHATGNMTATGLHVNSCTTSTAGVQCEIGYTRYDGVQNQITYVEATGNVNGQNLNTTCPGGYSVGSTCIGIPAGTGGSTGGQTSGNIVNATSALPQSALSPSSSYSFPTSAVATAANEAWRYAAEKPGYTGAPYSYAEPITAADVAAARAANPALATNANDWLSNVPASDTTAPLSPTNSMPSAALNPAPATQSAAKPAADATKVDLGPDPGVGAPTLEKEASAQSILDPLLNLFPQLRHFAMPTHAAATCPTASFRIGLIRNEPYIINQHCPILDDNKNAIYASFLVGWTVAAVFIFLKA